MDAVLKNPFRILGLPANSSEKDIQKQLAIIKRYAEVNQNKSFDFDFSYLGAFNRSSDMIKDAQSKIEQAFQKIYHSIFWFTNLHQVDEIAFSCIKNNDAQKAIENWEKLVSNHPITDTNFSAYGNLSTINLALSSNNGTLNMQMLKRGIGLKVALLTSPQFKKFSQIISGSIVVDGQQKFLDNFIADVGKLIKSKIQRKLLSLDEAINLFSDLPIQIRKKIFTEFTSGPLKDLENKIEKASNILKIDPKNGYSIGNNLFLECRDEIINLKKILGIENLQFRLISNKLAAQIDQCSILYFNARKDETEYDPGDDCFRLTKYADHIAIDGQVKTRIREGIIFLGEWIEDAPNRKVFAQVSEESVFIFEQLNNILYATVETAKSLYNACRPKLNSMKAKLGKNSVPYINLSSAVANNVLGMLIEVVNGGQKRIEDDPSYINQYMNDVPKVVELIERIETLDVNQEIANRIQINKQTIVGINSELNKIKVIKELNQNSGGCYIATSLYGSYDHSQVIKLRSFRDNKLLQNSFGILFVKSYYLISPKLVKWLEKKPSIQLKVRKLLDKLIRVME